MGQEMGERLKMEGIYVPMADFMLRFDQKQNSVQQLSFNKKINLKTLLRG